MPLQAQACAFIAAYQAQDLQEEADRASILARCATEKKLLTRDNTSAHFTASAWICNPRRDKVLLAYHRLYDAWTWTGGHADGDPDLGLVALREAHEETGLKVLCPLAAQAISLEILPVKAHWKHGQEVRAHLHLNLSFAFIADEKAPLRIKEDENLGLQWFFLDEVIKVAKETQMHPIYEKLNARILALP